MGKVGKDLFRSLQSQMNAPIRGRRNGKRAVYGCGCCRDMSLKMLKRVSKRRARRTMKNADRQIWPEYV